VIALLVSALVAHAPAWQTCVPRQIDYLTTGYRIDNDLFAGKHGRSCIRSVPGGQGANLTITTSASPQPGGVVEAPSIRVGPWYGSGDPASIFPLPVAGMPRIVLHVSVTGHPGGEWLADTDTYGYASVTAVTGNPAVELVIASRWHDYRPAGGRVRVAGHWWRVARWTTGAGSPMGPHPIIVFTLVRQDPRLREVLPLFIAYARGRGWWPAGDRVAGNSCLQGEVWSGGRGLRLGLDVTSSLPVIRPG
jgi:hypothetical protein